jgi:hypothetical protein
MATKALRTFIRIDPLLKSEQLGAKSELTFYKALITFKMTYACPAWEFAVVSHLLKLQRLQNIVLRTTGNISRRTATRALHLAFQIPYVYDYITKICNHQCGFRRNRSTTDQIFYIRQILEKKWEYNGTMHQLFIDFKKAYDSVKREGLYNILF